MAHLSFFLAPWSSLSWDHRRLPTWRWAMLKIRRLLETRSVTIRPPASWENIKCLIKIVNLLLIHSTRTWLEILWILNLWCNTTSGMDDYRIRMTLYTCICKSWVKLSKEALELGPLWLTEWKCCILWEFFFLSDGARGMTESIYWFVPLKFVFRRLQFINALHVNMPCSITLGILNMVLFAVLLWIKKHKIQLICYSCYFYVINWIGFSILCYVR